MTNIFFVFPNMHMFSTFDKGQITRSYAKVLVDILLSSPNCITDFENLQQAFSKLENLTNFTIHPLIVKEYKKAINKSSSEVDTSSELQQFLLTIFKRRYGFLLGDIIENTKAKLQNKLNKVKVLVYSCKELSSILKTNVEDEIRKQIGNADIEYKINKNISDNRIDFVANGNICSINLRELSGKLLQVNE